MIGCDDLAGLVAHPEQQLGARFFEGIVDAGGLSEHARPDMYVRLTTQRAGKFRGGTAVPLELIVLHTRLE